MEKGKEENVHMRGPRRPRVQTDVLGLFSKYEPKPEGNVNNVMKEEFDGANLYHTRRNMLCASCKAAIDGWVIARSHFV